MALVDYSSSSESDPPGDSPPAEEQAEQPSSKRRKSSGGVPVSGARAPLLPADCSFSSTNDEKGARDAKTEEIAGQDRKMKLASSSNGQQQQKQHGNKCTKSKLPPLPDEFYDLYASNVRTAAVDDPALHQGRKRLTPHMPGNWPTHLYIEWHPSREQHDALVSLVNGVRKELGAKVKLTSFLTSDLGAPLPLHVSLSRPIVLETATKDNFLEQLTGAVECSKTHPFRFSPRSLKWYFSPDSNRKFLVLRVETTRVEQHVGASSRGQNQNAPFVKLLKRCNTIVEFFDQPTLYGKKDEVNDDAFHVSIAWTFDVPNEEACRRALELLRTGQHAAIRSWEVDVTGVKVKIGNQVTHVALPASGSGMKVPRKNLFV